MAIAKRARGASDTIVQLSDDSVTTLSAYRQTPGGLTIARFGRGAGNPTIKDSAGNTTQLVQHLQAVAAGGTDTITNVAKGAGNTTIEDDAGNMVQLADYEFAQEVAAAVVSVEVAEGDDVVGTASAEKI